MIHLFDFDLNASQTHIEYSKTNRHISTNTSNVLLSLVVLVRHLYLLQLKCYLETANLLTISLSRIVYFHVHFQLL